MCFQYVSKLDLSSPSLCSGDVKLAEIKPNYNIFPSKNSAVDNHRAALRQSNPKQLIGKTIRAGRSRDVCQGPLFSSTSAPSQHFEG